MMDDGITIFDAVSRLATTYSANFRHFTCREAKNGYGRKPIE